MKTKATNRRTRKKLLNMLFILPLLAFNICFFLVPFLNSLYMSFFDWKLLGENKFIGFSNYIKAFGDHKFQQALIFTLEYGLLVTPLLFIFAFVMAILVNRKYHGVGLFRTIFFIPVVISMTSASDIWLWIYNELYGILNYILLQLHILSKPVAWMHMPNTSLPAVCAMVTWKMAGFSMLILLGAFQAIDEEIYDSARIDGASGSQRFFRITFPLIRPTFGLALMISVIGSVLAFEQFQIMTHGGPSGRTQTAVYYIYETAFDKYKFGYGSAMSVLLVILLFILTYFQSKITRDPTK